MKKTELVYREILFQAMENKNRSMTQAGIAKALKISLSTVNLALKPLVRMNAVQVKTRSFDAIDLKKILYCWASIRNLEKDIAYATRVEAPVKRIESEMPDGTLFTACSGYKLRLKDVPADYSEVYAYGDEATIQKRFPANNKNPNLFILKKDPAMKRYGRACTLAQLFVDLWNLKEWYAKDFLTSLERKLNGLLE